MTCPDWTRLRDSGDDFLRPGAAARRAALEHAEDCGECRRQALLLDPSLAAAGVPIAEATVAEVDSIVDGVLAMRRLRRFEDTPPRRRVWGRLAAVACLTCAILLFAEETGDRSPGEPPVAGRLAPLLSEDYRLYGSLPLVESLAPAEARIYQLGRDDFSVVWIVDESIEVSTKP